MGRGGRSPEEPPQEVVMRGVFVGTTAALFGGVLFCPSARAADTMMLAGVGSLSSALDRSAPTVTLELTDAKKADTVEAYFPLARGAIRASGRLAWGTARVAAGYPFRGWGWYRPWGGWYRPWGLGWWRPWGWYRPWIGVGYGAGYAYAGSWYGGYYPGVSVTVGGGYPCGCGYGSSIEYAPSITYPTPAPPAAAETGPPPQPRNVAPPIPERAPMPMTPPANPPRPITPPTAPAIQTVVRKAPKKLEYPAYGESPNGAPSRPDRLLVNDSR
jgi:hypothetical protein